MPESEAMIAARKDLERRSEIAAQVAKDLEDLVDAPPSIPPRKGSFRNAFQTSMANRLKVRT